MVFGTQRFLVLLQHTALDRFLVDSGTLIGGFQEGVILESVPGLGGGIAWRVEHYISVTKMPLVATFGAILDHIMSVFTRSLFKEFAILVHRVVRNMI